MQEMPRGTLTILEQISVLSLEIMPGRFVAA
jgi:hypothetical protein